MFVYQKFGSVFLQNFSLKFQRVPKIKLFCPFCQNLIFWFTFLDKFFLYRVTQKCFEKKIVEDLLKEWTFGQNFLALFFCMHFPNMPNGLKIQLLLEIQCIFYCINLFFKEKVQLQCIERLAQANSTSNINVRYLILGVGAVCAIHFQMLYVGCNVLIRIKHFIQCPTFEKTSRNGSNNQHPTSNIKLISASLDRIVPCEGLQKH